MAKFTVTITVIFSLFVVSYARFPLNQPANILTEWKSASTTPSESETLTISIEGLPESNTGTITAIGITRPSKTNYGNRFHPINRHFRVDHPEVYPLPHGCRYNGKPMVKPREIPYGNDMLMSEGKPSDHQINGGKPMSYLRVNGEALIMKPLGHVDGDDFSTRVMKRSERVGHVDADDFSTQVETAYGTQKQDEVKEERKEKESGLWKKIRKFLNDF